MKKRVLSILLTLCMLLGLMPTVAFAEEPHIHCVCGGENSVGDHTAHTAATWTGISALSEITAEGNYYLKNDVTLSDTWECGIDSVNLCLNGKTISIKFIPLAIAVTKVGKLAITDCRETVGKISGITNFGSIDNAGTLTLWNGSITDNDNACGVVNSGTFTMNGGSIENIRAGLPVGAVNNYGTFTMNGGSIKNNFFPLESSVGAVANEGTFTMNGGSITDNIGGGVFNNGTFTVSGDVNISGNVSGGTFENGVYTGGSPSNVYLFNGKTVSVESGKSLARTAKIGITAENPASSPTVVTLTNNTTVFFSDNVFYQTEVLGLNKLCLTKVPTYHTTIPVLTNQDFVVTAYEGWQLSLTSSDGWVDSLTVSEESNDGTLEFYVRHKDSGAVSEKVTETYKIDKTPPVISGAEDGKFYYEDITLTAADDNFLHFRLDGIPQTGETVLVLTVNEEATWDTFRVSAFDKANNAASITIYNGHRWSEWLSNGDGTHTRTSKLNENNTLTDDCHGGTANCRSGAVCEDCKTAYGAPDPDNHTNLRHFPAKAATKKAEGNIEYWYCDGCGRYFADGDGTKELQKADVITEKLKDNTVSPSTGDLGNPAGVIALMCISVIIIIFTTIISMMKQHFKR